MYMALPFRMTMNLNEECIYLRKKLIKRPLVGKDTKEIQYSYVCLYKENYMDDEGCPPPNVCKGYNSTGIRIINVD